MTLTIPYPTLSDPIDSTEIMANFASLEAKLSNIRSSDIASSANISNAQLASPYQQAIAILTVRQANLAAGWPGANTVLAAAPIPGVVGEEAWVVTRVTWCCTDTGAGTGTAKVSYGSFTGGAFTEATSIKTFTISNTGGANQSYSSQQTGGGTLAFDASPRSLALVATGADATTLSAASSFLTVTVAMRRGLLTA